MGISLEEYHELEEIRARQRRRYRTQMAQLYHYGFYVHPETGEKVFLKLNDDEPMDSNFKTAPDISSSPFNLNIDNFNSETVFGNLGPNENFYGARASIFGFNDDMEEPTVINGQDGLESGQIARSSRGNYDGQKGNDQDVQRWSTHSHAKAQNKED